MKLFKINKPTRTQLVHKELSKEINSVDAQLRIKHKGTAQKTSVIDFKKLKKKVSIKDFTGSIKSGYQNLIEKIDQTLAGSLSIFQSTNDISTTKAVIADYKRKIEEITAALSILIGMRDETTEQLVARVEKWNRKILWVLYILGFIEVLANFSVFELLGGNLIAAIAISCISVLGVFWWAHLSPTYIVRFGGNNRWRQLLVFSIFATPMILIFYLFSEMRITTLLLQNPEMQDVFVSSPMVPTLINFFGYLISCYLVYAYRPLKSEIEAYKKYRSDTLEIERMKAEKERLITTRNNEVPLLLQKLTDHYNFLVLAGQLEREVQTRYEGCFEEFKSELYLRTNASCDPLFSGDSTKDILPLTLKYQNIDKTQFELCEDLL